VKRYLSILIILGILILMSACDKKSQQPKQIEVIFYEPNITHIGEEDWTKYKSEKCYNSVLGESDVYKYVNSAGATVNEIIYATKKGNEKPNILTAFLASDSWEKDINSDGINEIIYTFGSPGSNIRINFLKEGKLLEVDLNECVDSPSVRYIEKENVFIINYMNDSTDYRYSLKDNVLVME